MHFSALCRLLLDQFRPSVSVCLSVRDTVKTVYWLVFYRRLFTMRSDSCSIKETFDLILRWAYVYNGEPVRSHRRVTDGTHLQPLQSLSTNWG